MQPEFSLDRNLGRRLAEELRSRGWVVHCIADVFPEDGQHIPDAEWTAHGLDQFWVPLTKSGRIKTRDQEIQPVLDRSAVLFHLDNQQLRGSEMVQRLDTHRSAVHRAVEKGGPAAHAIRHDCVENTWP